MPTTKSLVTAEDLLRPGNPYDRGELWDGAWIAWDLASGPAGIVAGRILGPLGLFVQRHDLGWVTGSTQGFLVRRDPDRVLCADVAFTSYARLPVVPARGFIDVAPEFLVEVVSPDDRWNDAIAKGGVWIGHGCDVVWVVDPRSKRVAVLRPGLSMSILEGEGVADASPALTGFHLPLADIFARIP